MDRFDFLSCTQELANFLLVNLNLLVRYIIFLKQFPAKHHHNKEVHIHNYGMN